MWTPQFPDINANDFSLIIFLYVGMRNGAAKLRRSGGAQRFFALNKPKKMGARSAAKTLL
jgi:hypothetical protein